MEDILNFIEKNSERYLNELMDFLKIPSISSIPEHKADVERCALWLVENIKEAGIENVRLIPTAGHPIVYGEWLDAGNDAPTVLIYGHYDVQPVDPLDLWESPPFEPVIKNNKIYARGTSDDKGQVFTHLKSIESIISVKGKLPVNVKLLIEGEEESGTNHLEEFIEKNTDLLRCNSILVSDTEWFADNVPSICYSLRGISYFEVTLTGPNRDLHSGTFGGAVDNPIHVLCDIISNLKNKYGRITIPGFYDDVLPLTDEERNEFKKLPFDEAEYRNNLGIISTFGEYGYTTLERTWARPTLEINGISGGYTGTGAKTVLPSKASAKISMRLVPNQNSDDITEKATSYIKSIAPDTVKVEINVLHGGNPVLIDRNIPSMKAAIKAYKDVFGKAPVFMREGGSIPIIEKFLQLLKSPTILFGLGLPGDNIHSPNESFALANFFGGIKASAIFFNELKK